MTFPTDSINAINNDINNAIINSINNANPGDSYDPEDIRNILEYPLTPTKSYNC